MKQVKHLVLLVLASSAFTIMHAQELETPPQYNQYIMKQQENITLKFLAYNSAASHGKRAKKVEKLREKLLDEVQESRMNISSMPKFKGDGSFRDSSVSFLKMYFNVLNEDYAKIVNMEEIAEQSYDEMEAYLMLQEAIDKKLEDANERMSKAQKDFAAKNNMTLVAGEDKNSEKLKQVGAVNGYYHQVYLIFFRPHLQRENLMKALDKNNVNAIEQDRNALIKYCQDGLKKLDTLKAFQGDNNLKLSCKQMLQYYEKIASVYMKPITDYLLTNERFESIKKDYEKKSDPTKQDVDAYNKAVKDVNDASKKYNEAINTINNSGGENINNWNKAVDEFFDEHMPR